ncbi:MAG: transposase [Bacilli bacterium]|nr:transposase [Bacilli bacterium]
MPFYITEKLKINKIVQNKNLSKKIYNASWYQLIKQLEYKSKWKNKKFYQIETYYPSSQICNRCRYQNKKVKDLSIREWECSNCTNNNEIYINSSLNIMFEGLKLYMKKTTNELQSS